MIINSLIAAVPGKVSVVVATCNSARTHTRTRTSRFSVWIEEDFNFKLNRNFKLNYHEQDSEALGSDRKSHQKWHRKRHPKLHPFLLLKKFLKWQFMVCFSKLGFGAIFGVILSAIFFLLNWAPEWNPCKHFAARGRPNQRSNGQRTNGR